MATPTTRQPPLNPLQATQYSAYDKYINTIIIPKIQKSNTFTITYLSTTHDIRKHLKIFYKQTENIKESVIKLINFKKETETVGILNTKGKAKGSEGDSSKIIKYVKSFQSHWGKWDDIPIINDAKNPGFYNSTLKNHREILLDFILYVKIKVFEKFEKDDNIINPSKNIELNYENALEELKDIYVLHDKNIHEGTVPPTPYPFPKCYNFLDNLNDKIKEGLNSFKYVYVDETKKLLLEISNIKTVPEIRSGKLLNLYRQIRKKFFNIIQKYYYNDVRFKYKWSYQSLNNSFRKSKVKNFGYYARRFGAKMIPGVSKFGKYESKIHLGPGYKITPFIGVTKKFFDKPLTELEAKKNALEASITNYKKLLNEYEKKPKYKKELDYFMLKSALEKEIRKIKIIKYFLLKKTVRLTRKTGDKLKRAASFVLGGPVVA